MYSLIELLKRLGVSFKQAGKKTEDTFGSIMPVSQADENSLIFFNKPDDRTFELLLDAHCAVVLLEENWGMKHFDEIKNMSISIFLVEHPRLVVSRIMRLIYPDDDKYYEGIHSSASIHPEARIHFTVSIGPYCIIGKCEIGENSRIHAFTVIKDNSIIGKNVIIRESCLIGGCGFGFVRDHDGSLERMPHIGRVVIEDNVELFPYVNVDRGALGETRIKKGTKIDHYSHIGHNCLVGEYCLITAGTVLCGGSSIGARSWTGVGSIIKEKVSVDDDVTIGLGAVVVKNVEKGTIVAGVPAKPLKKGL